MPKRDEWEKHVKPQTAGKDVFFLCFLLLLLITTSLLLLLIPQIHQGIAKNTQTPLKRILAMVLMASISYL